MTGHPSWRLLPAAAPGIPTLLISTAFTADSYSVHLSDLANIWVESLDRRLIIKRGLVEDTSIDPSDGPDQIRRMLQLLRAAFDSSDAEHGNTSLTLARDNDGDSLVMHITCVLPKPLKPFKWPMHLKKCPQSTIASQLVLPMIQAHEARTREIDQLVSVLREKDGIITRLIDKLEATGMGLEHVFNALSGKRKVTRPMADAKVKGLAPFSEAEFRNQAPELRPVAQASEISGLLGSVFGSVGLQYKSDLDVEASNILNDWWTKLSSGKNVILSERPQKHEPQAVPMVREPEPSKEEEDDFQVQATPPGARSTGKRPSPSKIVDDDETSDGEDDAEAPPPERSPKAKPAGKAPGSRLGALGRNMRPSPSPQPPASSQRSTGSHPAPTDIDSETASDADETSSPPPPSPNSAPRRGGLGRIGGKAKGDSPARITRSPSPAPPAEEFSQLPRRHKLGMIGKKVPSPAPDASAGDDTRGRGKTPAAEPKKEPLRETSQERADRKRAELQKEMEKRAVAGPAKKKRKF
ncbi:hypothetical protein VTI74DRAFT_3033 [Chaetomium olivicolor]